MTPRSWEHWKERYESQGLHGHRAVVAGAWRARSRRSTPTPTPIAALDIEQIVDHYDKIIRNLDRPPIIMGHSFGGAFTQILLDRGLGAVGVGVSSATVKGILDLPLVDDQVERPGPAEPAQGEGGRASRRRSSTTRSRTPSPRRSRTRSTSATRVPAADHGPARGGVRELPPQPADEGRLRTARAARRCSSIGVRRGPRDPAEGQPGTNEAKYDDEVTITEYKLFEGRPHFPGAPGWEEVADFALAWAMEHASKTVAEHAAEDGP